MIFLGNEPRAGKRFIPRRQKGLHSTAAASPEQSDLFSQMSLFKQRLGLKLPSCQDSVIIGHGNILIKGHQFTIFRVPAPGHTLIMT